MNSPKIILLLLQIIETEKLLGIVFLLCATFNTGLLLLQVYSLCLL